MSAPSSNVNQALQQDVEKSSFKKPTSIDSGKIGLILFFLTCVGLCLLGNNCSLTDANKYEIIGGTAGTVIIGLLLWKYRYNSDDNSSENPAGK